MGHKVAFENIIPRTSYSLFIVDIPRLTGKELRSAIRHYLTGIYPGDLDQSVIDIIKNGSKKYSYLVFVLDKSFEGKPLPVSTLYTRRYFGRGSGRSLYLGDRWAEYVIVEQGVLVKSVVKPRDKRWRPGQLSSVFGPGDEPVVIFCRETDRSLFDDPAMSGIYKLRILDKDLKRTVTARISLFSNLSPERKRLWILLTILGISIAIGGGSLLYAYKSSLEERLQRSLREQELQDKLKDEERRDRLRLEELQRAYAELAESKVVGPYEIAELIAANLNSRTQIISATIKEGFFQIEAYAPDSLAVLEAFEKNRRIKTPRLQQIRPMGNRERFTLSATVLPEVKEIDPDISVKEQITHLETLVENLRNPFGGRTAISPSLFGVSIRSLLTKWGCQVNTYQYLLTDNGRELEFSIRSPSSRFFNFLQDVSLHGANWEVTLVQIRNLFPQNLLDVVLRVRSRNIIEDRLNDAYVLELEEASGPLPVGNISRHYFNVPLPAPAATPPAPVLPPPLPARIEQVSWLEYMGEVGDGDGGQFLYIKNTRTGNMMKLILNGQGDMSCRFMESGNIEARIGGSMYEIRRRK